MNAKKTVNYMLSGDSGASRKKGDCEVFNKKKHKIIIQFFPSPTLWEKVPKADEGRLISIIQVKNYVIDFMMFIIL